MTMFKVNEPVRKPLFEGVQGENEARSIQFDITPWVDELGDGVCTAKAKRSQDSVPYPVTVTKDGNTVTWKPTSTDTAYEGIGAFQLEYTVDSVLAKTCVWSTVVAPSLATAGDPPDPYDDWLADLQDIAADALQDAQDAEAWAVGQRGGVDVPNTDDTYENNAKYYAELAEERTLKAFAIGTASGAVASFDDGADDIPMKSCIAHIEPQQAGSGTPSPDNVRAISGWAGANVTRAGKNLWGGSKMLADIHEQVPASTVSGSEIYYQASQITGKRLFSTFKENTRYTFIVSLKSESANALGNICFRYTDNTYTQVTLSGVSANTKSTYAVSSVNGKTIAGIDGIWQSGGTTLYTDESGLFEGVLTTADFKAYQGTTKTVTWTDAGTVYGGTVDLVSGVLTVTHATASMTGKNWELGTNGSNSISVYSSFLTGYAKGTYVLCDKLPNKTGFVDDGTYGIWKTTSANYETVFVQLPKSVATSAAEAKTYIDGIGATLCYEVKTPTTYQLTPTEVKTLLGSNNVWGDTGDTEVEYRKDPTIAWNELANAIVALGGNI